jgi:hypothetical protein
MKMRILAGVIGQEIEEIPLRHERNEFAVRRQVGEIAQFQGCAAHDQTDCPGFLMRPGEKLIVQSKLVHDLQRRRVDGVSAEITQKIGMLLENQNLDTLPGEKISQHHTGRAAPDDAAAGLKDL